jgi:hypothetical protein
MSAQISSVPSIAAFNSLTGEVVTTLGLSAAGARSSFTPIFQSNGRLSAVDVAIAACSLLSTTRKDQFRSVLCFPAPTSLNLHLRSCRRTSFVVARVVQYTVATGLATRFAIHFDSYVSPPDLTSLLAVACLVVVRLRFAPLLAMSHANATGQYLATPNTFIFIVRLKPWYTIYD